MKLKRKEPVNTDTTIIFGSIDDLSMNNKIKMIQEEMINLQQVYFKSTMKIICFEAVSGREYEIKKTKVNKQNIKLSYNALHKKLKELQKKD